MGIVFDKAEAAWSLLETVKAHDEALDFTAFGEQLMDLFLGGVEGEIADVEGCCVAKLLFRLGGSVIGVVVLVMAFSSSLL